MKERIIILSIKPKYVNQILKGIKTIDFRRLVSHSIQAGDRVIIYSSSPEKALVGAFTIDKIIKENINNLWLQYQENGGVTYEEFRDYYQGIKVGYALILKEIFVFPYPIKLQEIKEELANFRVPQSYRYLKPDEILFLSQKYEITSSTLLTY